MKIAVAMSGGLDSTVVATLLRAEGHDVIGVSMAVWRNSLCCSFEDVERAKMVCRQLGIKHYLIDLMAEFKQAIVAPYVHDRLQGETPNPCPTCNRDFKMGLMWQKLLKKTQADYLATGHYCRISMDFKQKYRLRPALDISRDQSYMLWSLTQAHLARTLFPLGSYLKSEVRELGLDLGLKQFMPKRESQDLCFIVPTKQEFWQEQAEIKPGPILTEAGEVIGQHPGLPFFTPGQRRGLQHNRPERLFVTKIDPEANSIYVGALSDLEDALINLGDLHFFVDSRELVWDAEVRLRLHGPLLPAQLRYQPDSKHVQVQLETPIVIPARGQHLVAYDTDGQIILGGIIV